MSNNSNSSNSSKLGFLSLLTLLFIGLKLTNFIDWSWWWIIAPLWGPVLIFILIFVGIILKSIYDVHSNKKRIKKLREATKKFKEQIK